MNLGQSTKMMKGIEKVKQTFGNLNKSTIRFPISMICSAVLSIYLILEIENGGGGNIFRMICTLVTALLLSINIHLLEESVVKELEVDKKRKMIRTTVWLLGGVFLCYMYFVFLKPVRGDIFIGHEKDSIYLGLNLFFVVLATYISKFKRKEAYVVYIFELIGSITKAFVYSVVMFLGLSAIIFTLVHLLELPLHSNIYGYIESVVFNLFFVAVFLSDFPNDKDEFEGYEMGRVCRALMLSIVVPLLSIYTVILYIYFAKIIVLSEWPNGLVGNLVLWYALVSVAVLFFLSQLQKSKPFIKKFSVCYSVAMLPMIGMMFVSLWLRIKEYGITENRYYVIMAGVWVCCSVLYYVVHYMKKQDSSLICIPFFLSIIVLCSSVGPMSAYQVEKRSQVHELVKVLQKNDMIQEGKIVPKKELAAEEKAKISELVSYIMKHHEFEDIPNMPYPKKEYSFEKVFGFYEVSAKNEWVESELPYLERAELDFYRHSDEAVEDISQYDRKYEIDFYSEQLTDNHVKENKSFIDKTEDSLVIHFYGLGDTVYTETISLDELYDKVKKMEERKQVGEQVEPYLDYEGEHINYRFVLRNITLERTKNDTKDTNEYRECMIHGELYYVLKK